MNFIVTGRQSKPLAGSLEGFQADALLARQAAACIMVLSCHNELTQRVSATFAGLGGLQSAS
jgi:hypothetical protein